MKNLQEGFIGLVITIIIGLFLIGGGTYVYLNEGITKSENKPNFSNVETHFPTPTTKEEIALQNLFDQDPIAGTVSSFRLIADFVRDHNSKNSNSNFALCAGSSADQKSYISCLENSLSYASLCSNGLIDTKAHNALPAMVQNILTAQGVSSQSDAGIICIASKDKYVLEVTFKKPNVSKNLYSYCVDSTNANGYNTEYKIDKANINCKLQ